MMTAVRRLAEDVDSLAHLNRSALGDDLLRLALLRAFPLADEPVDDDAPFRRLLDTLAERSRAAP